MRSAARWRLGAWSLVLLVPDPAVALLLLGVSPFLMQALPAGFRTRPRAARRMGSAVGSTCMTLMVMTGVVGPLLDRFFLGGALDRREIVATKAACQTIGQHEAGLFRGAGGAGGASRSRSWRYWRSLASMAGTMLAKRFLEAMTDAGVPALRPHHRDHCRLLHHPRHHAADHFRNSGPIIAFGLSAPLPLSPSKMGVNALMVGRGRGWGRRERPPRLRR